MNYPFETTKRGNPILDTEEKLQWYMNRLLHREVDLYYVNAEACDLDTVYLGRRKCLCLQQANSCVMPDSAPTFIEPDHYGRVDRSVVPVLRAIHARRDAELAQRSKEIGEKERESRNEIIDIEKEEKGAEVYIFDRDTRNYRLTRFKNELPEHFNEHYCLMYFLLMELLAMIDSGTKNMFWATWGERHEKHPVL